MQWGVGEHEVELLAIMKQHLQQLVLVVAMLLTNGLVWAQGTADEAYNEMKASLTASTEENTGFDLTRMLIYLNDVTSDEAYIWWNDAGLPELRQGTVTISNPCIYYAWKVIFSGIGACNAYLDAATNSDATTQRRRAEARMLRALYYSYAIDLWGDVPLRKTSNVDAQEKRTSRSEVFSFIVDELTEVGNLLPEASDDTSYGSLTAGAAQLLLARLYLNSEVYTGTARWAEAKTAAEAVMGNNYYKFASSYEHLFMGDNDTNGAQRETVLPVVIDGGNNQWGNTTFLVAASYGYDMPDNGLTQKWEGLVLRKQMGDFFNLDYSQSLYTKAESQQASGDERCLILSNNYQPDMTEFYSALKCLKYTNLRSDGTSPTHTEHADTDFPLLRLAEAYLIWAEADARQNGGTCTQQGKDYFNELRKRAKAAEPSAVKLSDICDEWAREFYLEGQRRPQLVRFGRYGGTIYQWEGKGQPVRDLMPIPSAVLAEHAQYSQNAGYEDTRKVPEHITLNTPQFATTTVDLRKFVALVFNCQRPDIFTDDEEVTYSMQLSRSSDFTENRNITSTNEQILVASSTLYDLLGELGVADDATTTVYARVECHGTVSQPITFSIVRSKIQTELQLWYLTGSDIGDGSWGNSWNSIGSAMTPMFVQDGVLTYTDYFGGQGFKAIRDPGYWDYQVGQESDGDYRFNEGWSSNITLNGYYKLTLDEANKYFIVEQLGFTPSTYSSIGIVGDFNSWGGDVAMKRLANNSHTWYAELTLDAPSGLKMRANSSWNTNWGCNAFPYGLAVQDGANISVPAGQWQVFFNDISGHYLFIDATTHEMPASAGSERLDHGQYANTDMALIGATAVAYIDTAAEGDVSVITLDDGQYFDLSIEIGRNLFALTDNTSMTISNLKNIAENYATDKTISVENGKKIIAFTATVWGQMQKNDLRFYSRSTAITIKLTEPLNTDYETNYYYVGDQTGWSTSDKSRAMTNEGNGRFSYTWTVSGSEWFVFAPESAFDNQNEFWNMLVRPVNNGEGLGTGSVSILSNGGTWYVSPSADTDYCMTLDLQTMTYTLKEVTSTGISKTLANGTLNAANGIYDLQGRRIAADKPCLPGLYIVNGRKVVVTKK